LNRAQYPDTPDIAPFFLEKRAREIFFNISKVMHSPAQKLGLTPAATTRTMRSTIQTGLGRAQPACLPASLNLAT